MERFFVCLRRNKYQYLTSYFYLLFRKSATYSKRSVKGRPLLSYYFFTGGRHLLHKSFSPHFQRAVNVEQLGLIFFNFNFCGNVYGQINTL